MGYQFGFWCCVLGLSITLLSPGERAAFAAKNCTPFFDDVDNPVMTNVFSESEHKFIRALGDLSPAAPQVDNLDEAFLEVCGEWGSKVPVEAIHKLLDRFSDRLMRPLQDQLPADETKAHDKLVRMWTGKKGFEHIFCGQPTKNKIGGLHFGARYLQLQREGAICRKMNNEENEELLEGRVYTMGIDTGNVSDPKKGYALGERAIDIFYEASWLFLRHCTDGSHPNFGCLSRSATDPTVYNKFFCAQGRGVITRYSVASGETMKDAKCDEIPRRPN